ncbi:hypothetical protein B0T25DRAFT_565589 [Lasiosphaeria hispida]|uniref:Ankyrin n=1 Tax=Lasiosphaeria hispida TaxID=260671 RepID=A0AAJ0HSQ7_9PEZI|nr:hypothetical protein B0T25DRAFT_565589 [Lasiosphaeria hispida]
MCEILQRAGASLEESWTRGHKPWLGKFSLAVSALAAAVEEGEVELVAHLIGSAAEIGHPELADILLEVGADVNALPTCRYGGTALQLASNEGYLEVARRLLRAAANINAGGVKSKYRRWGFGRVALEGAVEHGRLEMVHFLLEGANGGFRYLEALAGGESECMVGGNTCARVSCSTSCGIFLCSKCDGDFWLPCRYIVSDMAIILGLCTTWD